MQKNKVEYLSALSLDQPFAHMICHLKMNVESRNWTTKRRGTIAIHATAKISKQEFEWVNRQFGLNLKPADVDFASVIGIADVVDVITEDQVTKKTSKWFIGPYGFVLENIVLLPRAVPTKGNRKFWRLKGKALEQTLSQLTPTQLQQLRPFM